MNRPEHPNLLSSASSPNAAGVSRRQFVVGGLGVAAALLAGGDGSDSTTEPPATTGAPGSAPTTSAADAAATREFSGAWGPVTIPASPQRIVTVGTAITATMLALEVTPVGAALGNFAGVGYMSDKIADIADVGAASVTDVNREAVLALEPDLVLAHGFDFQKEAIAELNRTVPTVGLVTGYTELEETYEFWRTVGDVCGDAPAADSLVDEFQARVDELATRVGSQMTDKPITIVRVGTDGFGVRTGSIESSIPKALGIPRPTNQQDTTSTGFDLGLENIDQLDAWAIFVFVDSDAEDSQTALTSNALWATLTAVQQGRTFFVDASAWNAYDPFAANIILDDLDSHLSSALSAS